MMINHTLVVLIKMRIFWQQTAKIESPWPFDLRDSICRLDHPTNRTATVWTEICSIDKLNTPQLLFLEWILLALIALLTWSTNRHRIPLFQITLRHLDSFGTTSRQFWDEYWRNIEGFIYTDAIAYIFIWWRWTFLQGLMIILFINQNFAQNSNKTQLPIFLWKFTCDWRLDDSSRKS